jgi:WD40 repeat protein
LVASGLRPGASDKPKFAVFDAITGRQQIEFDLQSEPETNVQLPFLSISNDGARIVHAYSGADGWQTVIREGSTGRKIVTLISPNPAAVWGQFAISPDGAFVVVEHMIRPIEGGPEDQQALYEWEATVFDAATGKPLVTLPSQRVSWVLWLWSSDGKQLLRQAVRVPAEGEDTYRHESRLYDARSGEELWSRTDESNVGMQKAMDPCAWSADGKFIAVERTVSGNEAAMELWDAATGKTLASLALPRVPSAHDADVEFSPDSRMLAMGDWQEIFVWDIPEISDAAEQPVEVSAPSLTLANTHGPLRALCFTEGGRQIRAVTGDTITTWDVTSRDGSEALQPRGTNRAQFSPDATRLAVPDRNGGVTIWDTTIGQPVGSIPQVSPSNLPAESLVFSPDGRQLVIQRFRPVSHPELGERAGGYWEFWLHSVDDGRLLAHFDSTSLDSGFVINSVRFRPDGNQMAFAHWQDLESDRPAQLRVWDLREYVELRPVELPWRDAWLMGYSADGAKLLVAAGVGDHTLVATFDAATRTLQSTREFPRDDRCAFHARENRVSVHEKADLVFYDLATGDEVLRLQGFEAYNRAWSPDGRRLAAEISTTQIQSQIVLWSLESGRRLLTLDSPALALMTFSADSHRLLALKFSGRDAFASQIWDATPLPDSE